MDRREALGKLTGFVVTTGLVANVKPIDAEPMPLLAVLEVPEDVLLTAEAVANIREAWEMLWKGSPPFPVAVLQSGMKLSVITTP